MMSDSVRRNENYFRWEKTFTAALFGSPVFSQRVFGASLKETEGLNERSF